MRIRLPRPSWPASPIPGSFSTWHSWGTSCSLPPASYAQAGGTWSVAGGTSTGLAADAAFVAISAISPAQLDDHSYREAQLAAGIVEGRLHLAPYALGAAAVGMTFYDTLMPALLGEPNDLVNLLLTCVGVPEYTNRQGGGPRAPTAVKMIRPRLGDLT